MSLIKKPVLCSCVLQVQLYIFLPDNIFEVFLQKQHHSLVPLTFCTINHNRWYNFSTRYSSETLLQRNTKEVEKYRYFRCIKNLKNRYSQFMLPYFSFSWPFLHNICMRDINVVDLINAIKIENMLGWLCP